MTEPPRRLHWLGSPYLSKRTSIGVLEPEGTLPSSVYARLLDGSYAQPVVVDDGDERRLCFRLDGCVQTVMDRRDPDALLSRYTRKMMGFLLFNRQPTRILMIGLGGGSLVRYCRRHLPEATITVCEIDPQVIALRDEFQVPPDDDRLEVLQIDGAAYLAACRDMFDVILVDAFDRDGLSLSVMTMSFFQHARARLGAGGVFVMNAIDSMIISRACVEGVRAAFCRPIVPVSIPLDGNLILFGFESPVTAQGAASALDFAASLQASLGLMFPSVCRQMRSIVRQSPSTAAAAG